MNILKATFATLLLLLLTSTAAVAAPIDFTQEKFDKLMAENKPVLIDIAADWCPTCQRQATLLGPMMQEDAFKDITVLRVDFDDQKDVVKALKATRQSTLVIFNDGAEVDRSIAETNEERLRTFVSQLK